MDSYPLCLFIAFIVDEKKIITDSSTFRFHGTESGFWRISYFVILLSPRFYGEAQCQLGLHFKFPGPDNCQEDLIARLIKNWRRREQMYWNFFVGSTIHIGDGLHYILGFLPITIISWLIISWRKHILSICLCCRLIAVWMWYTVVLCLPSVGSGNSLYETDDLEKRVTRIENLLQKTVSSLNKIIEAVSIFTTHHICVVY